MNRVIIFIFLCSCRTVICPPQLDFSQMQNGDTLEVGLFYCEKWGLYIEPGYVIKEADTIRYIK